MYNCLFVNMNDTYIPLSDLYNYTCADKGLILPLFSEYTWSPTVRAALYLIGTCTITCTILFFI